MAFTFPKILCGFFHHHRTLYGQIARQVFAMITQFYNAVPDPDPLEMPMIFTAMALLRKAPA